MKIGTFRDNTEENRYSSESVGLIVARRPRGGGAWGSFLRGVPQLKNGARGCWSQKI